MDKIKQSEPKFSLTIFPLIKFLRKHYDFNTGRVSPNRRGSLQENSGEVRINPHIVANNVKNKIE
jgi:hypothetical protein